MTGPKRLPGPQSGTTDPSGPVEVLLVSGPAGVGKTSVAFEVSLGLQRRAVPHALIDTDELDRLYPVPDDQDVLAEGNLAAVWDGFARRGCRRLVLAGVWLHRASQRRWVERAVPGARVTAVRLMASDATIEARVRRREMGSGAADQLGRSLHQASVMASDADDAIVLTTDDLGIVVVAARLTDMWLP